jgi:hypothetical protein
MRRRNLTDRDLDRLLSGLVEPDDAPPGFERVAALLLEARSAAGVAPPSAPVAEQMRPRRRRAGRIAVAAVAITASSSAFAGLGALPSAASDLTGYIAHKIAELSPSSDPDEPPAGVEPPSTQPAAHQGTVDLGDPSTTGAATPPMPPPQAQGHPDAPQSASSDGKPTESKVQGPKKIGTLSSSGHAKAQAAPPPNHGNAGSGAGPPPGRS